MEISKKYVRKNYAKSEAEAILANPDYLFYTYTYLPATIHWHNIGQAFETDEEKRYFKEVSRYFGELITKGKELLKNKVSDDDTSAPKVRLTPQELLANKINNTVMVDLDELEDQWTVGQKSELALYEAFKRHELKGQAVNPVHIRLSRWLSEYSDAYNKTCPQMVEGYSHLPRTELKRRVTCITKMMSDLQRVKETTKATRQPRVPKTRGADKQVQKLQYLKESAEYKLMSVNPIQIPSAFRLFTFNAKTRVLCEYVTSSTSGFGVKGTSLQNFDESQSKSIILRKPNDIIPIILNKTPKQISTELSKLSTKESIPNGRFNIDTIILRILDK
jgi:hypothetical protein